MSLYSNILSYKRADDSKTVESKPSPSSASMKFLQDHLLAKQRAKNSTAPPKPKELLKPRQTVVRETSLHKPGDWDPDEEYDPMVPNSYEVLQAQHLKMRELELQNRSSSTSSVGKLAVPNMLEMLDKLESEEAFEHQEQAVTSKKTRGTAIAPPPVLAASNSPIVSSSSSNSFTEQALNKPSPAVNHEKLEGGSVAVKIMAKMGYKAGQGLGKDEQGMSKPLEVEKSGLNMGKILPAETRFASQQDPPASSEKEDLEELSRTATRVVLLQNMVGPGQVDDDLDSETKEECKKYGSVIKCVIYEIPDKKVAPEEAVRIFVEFRHVESAIRAVTSLNGKYFGGRIVRASFYDVNRFNKFELAPS